jgi:hypothetical protein
MQIATISTSNLSVDYTGNISYAITQNIDSKLFISGATLALDKGLNAGGYEYKLRVTASGDNKYNPKTFEVTEGLTISKDGASSLAVDTNGN